MDFVEQLKSSVDIVKTIQGYGVKLKRTGSTGRYLGLCPFHTEKTPSFNVNATMQRYKCFGCNVGGDVINFVMELERISFFEALKLLAETNGIPMPKREYSDPDSKLRGALFEMHEMAASTFHANLKGPTGTEARNYLAGRGVTPEQIDEFGLGVADPSGQQLMRRLEGRFAAETLEVSGLVLKRQDGSGFFDRFRGRLMFPIHNESGKVIGFGGRAMKSGDEPKYLNSPETALYRKSYVLYNLHRAKDPANKAGYVDSGGRIHGRDRRLFGRCPQCSGELWHGAHQHAGASDEASRRPDCGEFRSDTAGAAAAEKSIQMLLDEGLHVRVLELEGDRDPDEYVKEVGAETYRSRLEKAPAYFHWLADRARKKFDMRTVEGRLEGFKFVAPSIQRISDRLERFAVANDVADYLGVDEKLVRDYFAKGSEERRHINQRPQVPPYERSVVEFAARERGGAGGRDPAITRDDSGRAVRYQERV